MQSLTNILYLAIHACAATQDREEEAGVGVCKKGWSAWINQNKPIPYKTPGDVERIPAFIEPVRAHSQQRVCGARARVLSLWSRNTIMTPCDPLVRIC